jgi:DNA-binding NarL/FixJ family response regulator
MVIKALILEAAMTSSPDDKSMRDKHRARLLMADDHRLVADACRRLLEPEYDVVGVVTNGRALVQAAVELRPAVVILDVFMPELNGLDAGEQIKQVNCATKLVYLTMDPSPDIAVEALRRGASGYVLKDCAAEELIVAVRRVLCGESYLSPLITKGTIEFMLRANAGPAQEEKKTTARQREIVQLHAEGKSMKEIAHVLGVQPGTIAFHKYRIMKALGIDTNAALVQYAINHHMVAK